MAPGKTTTNTSKPVRVVVVGAGYVGSTTAYTLLLSALVAEIVLIDVNKDKADGEAMDLMHAAPFAHRARIWVGDYRDCADAAVVILTAGANQKPGQSRTELAQKNWDIFREMVPQVAEHAADDTVLLVSTNPVDVMTYATVKFSGIPPHRVIGSGTLLDSARFASQLGRHLQVDPASLNAIVIGEHGETELPVWSLATASGMRLEDYCRQAGITLDERVRSDCFERTKQAAADIIEKKGVTGFGVAGAITQIVRAVLHNQSSILPVSCVGSYAGVENVALSVLRKVGRRGCEDLVPLLLTEDETKQLRASAEKIRETIQSLESA